MRYLLPLLLLGLAGCATVDTPPLYHQMDKADVQLANQALAKALETRTKGQSLTWFNPANRHSLPLLLLGLAGCATVDTPP
ncbi:hypothetical protein OD806_14230, partial [Aeromonas veronii]|nr:hypothetical protein [Aeromonas veronii]MCX0447057.1 hypothetical protein [Aeromonas veronii]